MEIERKWAMQAAPQLPPRCRLRVEQSYLSLTPEVRVRRYRDLDSGQVLCDAPFAEIDGQEVSELLTANAQKETVAYYQIDVSLDTSVGNEYQAAKLLADFAWYVEDEGGLTPPPQTGDTTNLVLWAVLAASSLLLLIFLWKRRKEEGQHA